MYLETYMTRTDLSVNYAVITTPTSMIRAAVRIRQGHSRWIKSP